MKRLIAGLVVFAIGLHLFILGNELPSIHIGMVSIVCAGISAGLIVSGALSLDKKECNNANSKL